MANPLDEADRRILSELTEDGRMSMRMLSDKLHISRANAYARVERLRTDGLIRGSRADADPDADPDAAGLGTPRTSPSTSASRTGARFESTCSAWTAWSTSGS